MPVVFGVLKWLSVLWCNGPLCHNPPEPVTSPGSGPRVASGQKWSLVSPESVCGEHSYTMSVDIADCPGGLRKVQKQVSICRKKLRIKDAPGRSSFTRDQPRPIRDLGVDQ